MGINGDGPAWNLGARYEIVELVITDESRSSGAVDLENECFSEAHRILCFPSLPQGRTISSVPEPVGADDLNSR